jgi:hypothetical protein
MSEADDPNDPNDGLIASRTLDAQGNTLVFSLPEPANSRVVGYIHTHPDNVGFSPGDLDTAHRLYSRSARHNSAYVALPNGSISAWSTTQWASTRPPFPGWQHYLHQARQVRGSK